jgi:hypothetical protein
MQISDYAQLRRRAEQCRAEEMARLFALLKQTYKRWRARHEAASVAGSELATARRRC